MRITLTSVFVDDQRTALDFYTSVLGFEKKTDIPVGEDSWLTVVSQEDPTGPELLLEPSDHPAVKPFRDALMQDGIPALTLAVSDIGAEVTRLSAAGVEFVQAPTDVGTAIIAVLDDTCGNLVMLTQATTTGD
jgi:catechol 2,3-dioxygenase-like lactoylglutathione lyase family enzyme